MQHFILQNIKFQNISQFFLISKMLQGLKLSAIELKYNPQYSGMNINAISVIDFTNL